MASVEIKDLLSRMKNDRTLGDTDREMNLSSAAIIAIPFFDTERIRAESGLEDALIIQLSSDKLP